MKIEIACLLGLVSMTNASSVVQRKLMTPHEYLQLSWDQNLPNLYDNQDGIIQYSGSQAADAFTSKPLINGQPELMLAYHPQCPHCHSVQGDIIKLSEELKSEDLGASVVAINMSTAD